MDKQDSIRIVSAVNALAEFFKESLSELRLEFYVSAIEEFSPEQVEAAAREAVKTLRFFPKPVELIDLIQGSVGDRAEQAWQIAWEAYRRAGYYESVLFEDGAIGRTIQIVFGGWIQFSETSRTLSPEMFQARRKEFLSTYKRESRHLREPVRLQGHYEIENMNTVATWNRDRFGEVYRQQLYVASESGGRFVSASFSRRDARLIESTQQLLEAAKMPELPPAPRKALPPPLPQPSEEARRMTPAEIQAGIQALIKSVRSRL